MGGATGLGPHPKRLQDTFRVVSALRDGFKVTPGELWRVETARIAASIGGSMSTWSWTWPTRVAGKAGTGPRRARRRGRSGRENPRHANSRRAPVCGRIRVLGRRVGSRGLWASAGANRVVLEGREPRKRYCVNGSFWGQKVPRAQDPCLDSWAGFGRKAEMCCVQPAAGHLPVAARVWVPTRALPARPRPPDAGSRAKIASPRPDTRAAAGGVCGAA